MAMTLVEQHQSVYLVDSPKPNTSSRIAAGIMNPITGKRMTLTWEAESFFLEAIAFYRRMEERFGDNFLFEKPIVRIFSSVAEQNDWTGKCQDKKYTGFIRSGALDHGGYTGVETPYGSMQVNGGGRLDTNRFLDNVRSYFIDKNQFVESEVEMSDVITENGKVTWKNITAKHIIYCTGTQAMEWDYLPFTPMKGEVLEVSSSDVDDAQVYVGGCFLCPTQKNQFYAGATYDWRNTNLEKTEKAKSEILEKVSKFVTSPVGVLGHRVGIRPAVKDRRPLLGQHPEKSNQYLFSGLGSKGVSMAPALALQLYAHIAHDASLDEAVNLNRFE